jgi:hypothetical protein
LKIVNELRYEELSPAITYRHLCHPMRPAESKIAPLDGRELFPDGQQIFALKLAYTFNGMS